MIKSAYSQGAALLLAGVLFFGGGLAAVAQERGSGVNANSNARAPMQGEGQGHAQPTTTNAPPQPSPLEIDGEARIEHSPFEEDVQGMSAERSMRTIDLREVLTLRAKVRIEAYANQMTARMSAMTERLEGIAARLQTHIDISTEQGIATSDAQAELDAAILSLAEAHTSLRALQSASEELFIAIGIRGSAQASVHPEDIFAQIKALSADARDSLKEAHEALVRAVRILSSLELSGDTRVQ